jgi:hypothetical protein
MVVSRKCKSERIIGWKLCESKTEGIFGHNMGMMGMMVEDAFLDVRGHISHTILGNMARTSTAETDTVSVLCVAPVKIIISCSRHTPSASMMMHFVSVQESFFFDGRVNGSGKGRLKGFIIFKFFEHGSDFFNRRFRYAKCKVCANSHK